MNFLGGLACFCSSACKAMGMLAKKTLSCKFGHESKLLKGKQYRFKGRRMMAQARMCPLMTLLLSACSNSELGRGAKQSANKNKNTERRQRFPRHESLTSTCQKLNFNQLWHMNLGNYIRQPFTENRSLKFSGSI